MPNILFYYSDATITIETGKLMTIITSASWQCYHKFIQLRYRQTIKLAKELTGRVASGSIPIVRLFALL